MPRAWRRPRAPSESGSLLLVDGEDPWISIGAGGIALELTDGVERGELPPITELLVPVGNGALIGGIGAWIKAVAPTTRVVGVQAAAGAGDDPLVAGEAADRDGAGRYRRGRDRRARAGRAGRWS